MAEDVEASGAAVGTAEVIASGDTMVGPIPESADAVGLR
jgi:hypothetical protein